MLKLFRLSCVQAALFSVVSLSVLSSAHGQTTFLSRQLDRVDVAVGGAAIFTKSVSGTNLGGFPVTLDPSTTVGALVQVRYTKSPLLGAEFTYSYARFNQRYGGMPFGPNPDPTTNMPYPVPFSVQANMSEYTLGYVAHLPTMFGVQPFASAGGGVSAFKPTPLGGQGLPERGRASIYYDIGAEDQLSRHFGVRAQLRQIFYKAPDFGQNYLTINQRTFTTEPSVGFFIKF